MTSNALPLSPGSLLCATTRQAAQAIVRSPINILWREWMTMFAFRRLANLTVHVFRVGHWFKMGGVDATPVRASLARSALPSVMAGVVERQAIRDRANKQLVSKSMYQNPLAAGVKDAVSARCAAGPEPAGIGLGDESPEAVLNGEAPTGLDVERIAVGLPSLPVLLTPAASDHRFLAAIDRADAACRLDPFSLAAGAEEAPIVQFASASASGGPVTVALHAGHRHVLNPTTLNALPARPFLEET